MGNSPHGFAFRYASPPTPQPSLLQRMPIREIKALNAKLILSFPGLIGSRQRGQVCLWNAFDSIFYRQALHALCPQAMDTRWFINSWLEQNEAIITEWSIKHGGYVTQFPGASVTECRVKFYCVCVWVGNQDWFNQGHPTSIFRKYLWKKRRFEIYWEFSQRSLQNFWLACLS